MGHGLLNSEEERRQERGAARRRPLVLMVDDDRADRELYGTILCYNGFDVVLSRTGRDALTQAHRFAPDCVLLDLGLPGMSGLQVAEALRTDPDTEAVPVVALSGYSENTMGSRARAAGCDVYLEKPTEPVKVLKEIEGMVGRPPLSGVGDPPRILGPLVCGGAHQNRGGGARVGAPPARFSVPGSLPKPELPGPQYSSPPSR